MRKLYQLASLGYLSLTLVSCADKHLPRGFVTKETYFPNYSKNFFGRSKDKLELSVSFPFLISKTGDDSEREIEVEECYAKSLKNLEKELNKGDMIVISGLSKRELKSGDLLTVKADRISIDDSWKLKK